MKTGNLLNQVVQLSGPTIGTGTAATGGTVLVVIGAAGLVGLMIANSSGEIEKPQIKQDYSNWQEKGIKPSKEKGGKPRGEYEAADNEGVRKQNELADYLANEGYELEMLQDIKEGNGHGIDPRANPDWLLEGKVFDCYAPTTNNIKNLINEISGKTKRQTGNIVLGLDAHSSNQVNEILNMIQRKANPNGDLKRLTEILVIKDKQIIWKWTW